MILKKITDKFVTSWEQEVERLCAVPSAFDDASELLDQLVEMRDVATQLRVDIESKLYKQLGQRMKQVQWEKQANDLLSKSEHDVQHIPALSAHRNAATMMGVDTKTTTYKNLEQRMMLRIHILLDKLEKAFARVNGLNVEELDELKEQVSEQALSENDLITLSVGGAGFTEKAWHALFSAQKLLLAKVTSDTLRSTGVEENHLVYEGVNFQQMVKFLELLEIFKNSQISDSAN